MRTLTRSCIHELVHWLNSLCMQANQYRISLSTLLYLTKGSKAVSSADLTDAIAECQKLSDPDLNGLKGPIGYWDVAVYACVRVCLCLYTHARAYFSMHMDLCMHVLPHRFGPNPKWSLTRRKEIAPSIPLSGSMVPLVTGTFQV